MKKIIHFAICFSFLFAFVTYASEVRTWTSAGGQHKVEAEFVSVSDDGKSVILRRGDGKKIFVEYDKLSFVDKMFVDDTKHIAQQEAENAIRNAARNAARQAPEMVFLQNSPEKREILRRKIELVNPKGIIVRVKLSDEEKEEIVDFLIMAERALNRQYSEKELSDFLDRMHWFKEGNISYMLLPFNTNRGSFREIDVYVAALVGFVEARRRESNLGFTSTGRSSLALMNSMEREKNIIESLLPVCNRLTGNRHDNIEEIRLNTRAQEAEKKQLFDR